MASMIITVAEGFAVQATGTERAKLLSTEHALIDPSLARILARMPAGTVDRFGSILDPMMLGMGCLMYVSRLRGLKTKKEPVIPKSERIEATGGLDPNATRPTNGSVKRQEEASDIAPPPDVIRNLIPVQENSYDG